MKLAVHGQYELVNTATRQGAMFEILEIYQWRGHDILYGERHRYGVWIPSRFGRRQVSPGPAAFPLFTSEATGDVESLVAALRSLPLYLVLPTQRFLPILSLENAHGILGGERHQRNGMVRRAQQLVNLYLDWHSTKTLPEWFRLRRNLAATKN